MVAPTFSWNTIASDQVDANSPITEDLMEAFRQNQIHLEEWMGDGYTAAKDHDHDNSNSKSVVLGDRSVAAVKLVASSITQTELGQSCVGYNQMKADAIHQAEIATGDSSVSESSGLDSKTLPGGRYAFYPQVQGNSTNQCNAFISDGTVGHGKVGAGYITHISLGATAGTGYARTLAVTASGNTHWMFIQYNTITGKIKSVWESPDHPAYGQGENESVIKHPHLSQLCDPENYPNLQIILMTNDELGVLKAKRKRNKCICQIIHEEYTIDISPVKPKYQDREIIEIDRYGDLPGDIINTYSDGTTKKRRIVTGLPVEVEYRNLKKL